MATQLDKEKWQDLLENLRTDLDDADARFRAVYLIDDFVGTGTTFLRYDNKKAAWKGKLVRFKDSVRAAVGDIGEQIFEPGWEVCVHHYIGSADAVAQLPARYKDAEAVLAADGWAASVQFSFGMELPSNTPITSRSSQFSEFLALTEKYYDPVLRTRSTDVSGVYHMRLGYGACALPLVMEHNTPNNSVSLVWAETSGGTRDGVAIPSMRPLFRRRQRHIEAGNG